MSPTEPHLTDPRSIVSSLDADSIRARLTEIESEADAPRVLIRAARARERARNAGRGRQEGQTCRA